MPEPKPTLQQILLVLVLLSTLCFASRAFAAESKWAGVDEAVVEKIAKEHGREAKAPPINPSGDVLLFAFLAAGAVGGFAAGYYWRDLVSKK